MNGNIPSLEDGSSEVSTPYSSFEELHEPETIKEEQNLMVPFESPPITPQDAPKKNKRKRERCVTSACEYCRSRHIRCDGSLPCAVCISRNLKCYYDFAKRKKRGYAAKGSKIDEISTALVVQTQPTTLSELELSESSYFTSCLDSYKQFIYPFIGVPIPDHLSSLQLVQKQSSSAKLFMYSLLCFGAFTRKEYDHVEEFKRLAKVHFTLFEKTTPELIGGTFLLSQILMMSLELDAATNLSFSGIAMLGLLKEQKTQSHFAATIYLMAQNSRLELETCRAQGRRSYVVPESVFRDFQELIDGINDAETNPDSRIHLFNFMMMQLYLKAVSQRPYAECVEDFEKTNRVVCNDPNYQRFYLPMMYSLRAVIHYCSGLHDLAKQDLAQFANYRASPEVNLATIFLDFTAVQVKREYGMSYAKEHERLSELAERFPFISFALNQLCGQSSDPSSFFPIKLPPLAEIGQPRAREMPPYVDSSTSSTSSSLRTLAHVTEAPPNSFPESWQVPLVNVSSDTHPHPQLFFDPLSSAALDTSFALDLTDLEKPIPSLIAQPTQITVFYRNVEQTLTFRVTSRLTCGQVIEQTPLANPHKYVLVDKLGNALPNSALIVDLFSESHPCVEIREKPAWS